MSNILLGAYIELTEKCNLRCLHCYNNSGNSNEEISYNELKKLIILLKKNDINSVTFSGGEPFLYSYISNLLEFCGTNNIHANIITNLNYFNDEFLEKIKKYNMSLQISVDGIFKTYNEIRIKGNFDILKKNVDKAYNKKIIMSFHYVINKLNINEIEQFIELINANYPNTQIAFSFLNYSGRAIENINSLSITNEEKKKCIETINKFHEKNKFINKMEITTACPYLNHNDAELNVRVDSKGNVYPCQICSNEKYIIGNIYYDNIINIINSQAFYNLRNIMINNSKCKKCIWTKNCGHCCPIEVNDYMDSYGCYLIKKTNSITIQRINDELKKGIKLIFFNKFSFVIKFSDISIKKYKRVKKFFSSFETDKIVNPFPINIEKNEIIYGSEVFACDENNLCINILKIIEKYIIEQETNGVYFHGGLLSIDNNKNYLILGKSKSGKSTNIYKALLENTNIKYGGDDMVYFDFDSNLIFPFPKPIFLRNLDQPFEGTCDIEYINNEKRYIYYPNKIVKNGVNISKVIILNRNKKYEKTFIEEIRGGYKTIELMGNLKETINTKKIKSINSFASSIKIVKINYYKSEKLFESTYEEI